MWMFEKRGFTSTVAYDARQDRRAASSAFPSIAPNPGTHLLVRARVKEDLEVLREVCPNLIIETDPKADYSFRCVVTRKQMKQYMCNIVDGIDYNAHFKEEAAEHSTRGHSRYNAMMSVWSAMARLQPYTPYSGVPRPTTPETLGHLGTGTRFASGWWMDDVDPITPTLTDQDILDDIEDARKDLPDDLLDDDDGLTDEEREVLNRWGPAGS